MPVRPPRRQLEVRWGHEQREPHADAACNVASGVFQACWPVRCTGSSRAAASPCVLCALPCSVDLPVEEVPPELPEPVLGINFARDGASFHLVSPIV